MWNIQNHCNISDCHHKLLQILHYYLSEDHAKDHSRYSKHTFSWLENRKANTKASLPEYYLSDTEPRCLKALDVCESCSTSMHRDSL